MAKIYESFHLKTDDAEPEKPSDKPLKGRVYSTKYALQPGGLKVDEMLFGLKMAHISCTDDSEDRLKASGANVVKSLEEIVGKDDAHKPLSTLLSTHFNLHMDCWIDESGIRCGRPVDTQGFIASNEDTIVLSYRFSTTLDDWLTNLSMTSSEWEPDKDEIIGHAGWCSCLDGWFTKFFTSKGKPRVHTGFYNNFIYTIPMIRKHILEPLTKPGATPKKVYICGCSLGAAIATMAYCFVLQEMTPKLQDSKYTNHKLINVTAGCPRSCDEKMASIVKENMKTLRPLDRAVLCRLVYNHDMVPHVPFGHGVLGFTHLEKLVYITKEGEVIVNPNMQPTSYFSQAKHLFNSFMEKDNDEKEKEKAELDEKTDKSPFEIECETTPEPIMDHMAYWYLTFLEALNAREEGKEAPPLNAGVEQ